MKIKGADLPKTATAHVIASSSSSSTSKNLLSTSSVRTEKDPVRLSVSSATNNNSRAADLTRHASPAFVSPAKPDSLLPVERLRGANFRESGAAERRNATARKRRKIELESEILRKEVEIETLRKETEIEILQKELEKSMLRKALELLDLDEMDEECSDPL